MDILNHQKSSSERSLTSALKNGLKGLLGNWIFDFGAKMYDLMTANPVWQESCASLLVHVGAPNSTLHVLDLGIGSGVSALSMGERYPDTTFIGLDISRQMLALAADNREAAGWHQERLILVRGDVHKLPFRKGAVDAATGHSFLYLLPDHENALVEAHRVLRSGGFITFLEPYAGKVDWSWLFHLRSRLIITFILWRFYNWLHGRFSRESMRSTLEEAGFTHVETEVTLGGFGIIGRARKP